MNQTLFVPFMGATTNKIYSGVHYAIRNRWSAEGHRVTRQACELQRIAPVIMPVDLEFTPYHSKRIRDCSNYSFSVKIIEDGLVNAGILKDDNAMHVRSITILAPVKDLLLPSGFFVSIDTAPIMHAETAFDDDLVAKLWTIAKGNEIKKRQPKRDRKIYL